MSFPLSCSFTSQVNLWLSWIGRISCKIMACISTKLAKTSISSDQLLYAIRKFVCTLLYSVLLNCLLIIWIAVCLAPPSSKLLLLSRKSMLTDLVMSYSHRLICDTKGYSYVVLLGYKKRPIQLFIGTPSQSYGTSLVIWDHMLLPATWHKWMCPA